MHIIAGENNLTIMRQNVHRDNGVGLILKIEVARDSIGIADLEAIVQDIADNAREITVFDDNGEKVAILSGFHCEPKMYAAGGVYTVELIDASENTFQLGRQKLMIENLEGKAAAAEGQVAALGEMSVNQLDAIDSILTEVFPAVVAEAVSIATEQAVAQVLATINGEEAAEDEAGTDETPEETVEE